MNSSGHMGPSLTTRDIPAECSEFTPTSAGVNSVRSLGPDVPRAVGLTGAPIMTAYICVIEPEGSRMRKAPIFPLMTTLRFMQTTQTY